MGTRFVNVPHGTAAAALAYLIVASAVTGCEPPAARPGAGKLPSPGDLIVLIGPPAPSPQWPAIEGGARRFMQQYPSLRLETAAPPHNTREALARTVRDALSKKPEAVCLYITDTAAARPSAAQIVKSSTILVTIGTDPGMAGAFGHVQVDLAGGAELLGEHLVEIVAGKRSYLLVHSHGASPAQTRYYERFMQRARAHYGITLLEEQNAAETKRAPTELLQEMFARFRHAGLAVTLDPAPWLSAPPAQLLGREARFATLGAVPALWPWLRSGEATALAGPLDGRIGSLAVEIALVAMTESRKPGLLRIVQSELVTVENLDDFARRYAEAAGLEPDELLPQAGTSRPAAPPTRVPEP